MIVAGPFFHPGQIVTHGSSANSGRPASSRPRYLDDSRRSNPPSRSGTPFSQAGTAVESISLSGSTRANSVDVVDTGDRPAALSAAFDIDRLAQLNIMGNMGGAPALDGPIPFGAPRPARPTPPRGNSPAPRPAPSSAQPRPQPQARTNAPPGSTSATRPGRYPDVRPSNRGAGASSRDTPPGS